MDNNKVIIYTLIILLIAAVIFNPVITGNALKLPWTTAKYTTIQPITTDKGVDIGTGSCPQTSNYVPLRTYAVCVQKCEVDYKNVISTKPFTGYCPGYDCWMYNADDPACVSCQQGLIKI